MTRKTDTTTGAEKPASRRKTSMAAAAGKDQATSRRRTKTLSDAGIAPATAARRLRKAAQPAAAAPAAEPSAGWAVEPPAMPAAEPTHDEIALRAWSIYESRGGSHSDAAADWFQAMTELRRERGLE